MKLKSKIAIAVILSLAVARAALALTQAGAPAKFNIPWGNAAGGSYIRAIPQGSQIGITNCAASLTDGFPPLTFTPSASGGCPPFGQDFNGILQQITKWIQWFTAGGPIFYDSGLVTGSGGYPMGAVIQSAVLQGRFWYSTADNNTTNPDSQTASGWIPLPGTTAAGTPIATFSATAPAMAVQANALTVGNAASNATNRANADTYWLFSFMWTNCGPCVLYNSAGGVIAKGASATADFNANDQIQVLDLRGRGLIGADSGGTTRLTGVPIISGNSTTAGSYLGENTHTLAASEIPSITSNASVSGTVTVYTAGNSGYYYPYYTANSWTYFNPNAASGGIYVMPALNGAITPVSTNFMSGSNSMTGSATSNNTGGGAHNNVEQSVSVYWWLSL